jgi:hypothetical protein
MLIQTLKVTDRFIEIPGIERYKGKLVEITVKELKQLKHTHKYKKFYSFCGKVNLDEERIDDLRKQSMVISSDESEKRKQEGLIKKARRNFPACL